MIAQFTLKMKLDQWNQVENGSKLLVQPLGYLVITPNFSRCDRNTFSIEEMAERGVTKCVDHLHENTELVKIILNN